ncbi:hypothetical protein ACLOJK_026254 [Asimina triloba]
MGHIFVHVSMRRRSPILPRVRWGEYVTQQRMWTGLPKQLLLVPRNVHHRQNEREMSQTTEENRKGLFSKHSSDDRKPAGAPINGAPQPPPPPVAGAAAAAAAPPPGVALKKVIVKSADMKEEMQKDAVECALSAVEKHNVEKDIAEYIKKEFDRKYGATWHCIVGRNFDTAGGQGFSTVNLPEHIPARNGLDIDTITPYLFRQNETSLTNS